MMLVVSERGPSLTAHGASPASSSRCEVRYSPSSRSRWSPAVAAQGKRVTSICASLTVTSAVRPRISQLEYEVVGIKDGWKGMLEMDYETLTRPQVSGAGGAARTAVLHLMLYRTAGRAGFALL